MINNDSEKNIKNNNNELLHNKIISKEEIENYTCYKCLDVYTCKYAYDDYNTNGDCLAQK